MFLCGTLGKFQPRKNAAGPENISYTALNPVGKSCQPYEEPSVFSSVFNGRGSYTGWPPNLTFKTVPAMTHNLIRQMGPINGRLGGMSEPQGELTARKDALKCSRRTCSRGGEGFRNCGSSAELNWSSAAAGSCTDPIPGTEKSASANVHVKSVKSFSPEVSLLNDTHAHTCTHIHTCTHTHPVLLAL